MNLRQSFEAVRYRIAKNGCCVVETTSTLDKDGNPVSLGYDEFGKPIKRWYHTYNRDIVRARIAELTEQINELVRRE